MTRRPMSVMGPFVEQQAPAGETRKAAVHSGNQHRKFSTSPRHSSIELECAFLLRQRTRQTWHSMSGKTSFLRWPSLVMNALVVSKTLREVIPR